MFLNLFLYSANFYRFYIFTFFSTVGSLKIILLMKKIDSFVFSN